MEGHRRVYLVGIVLGLLVVLHGAGGGCRRPDEQANIRSIEGTIKKITLTSDREGEITVEYTDSQGRVLEGTGVITKDTEVMINGALAQISDVKAGEKARGQVRIEKINGQRRQIVLKIQVDRAEPIDTEG